MNNFQQIIGIEVHVVVNAKTKMFSHSKSCHYDQINENVSAFDLAMPGLLPTVNQYVVEKAICLGKKLNMSISDELVFDRKNYFYPDLPKGFQITQKFCPIGINGYLEIKNEKNEIKKILIKEIHIEEDTAKQINFDNKITLDYNRSGMPLIEIVSDCNISSSYEAIQYLTKLKQILNFTEISDAKMEDGSLRADINLSVKLYGTKTLGTRVEIKNLNSFFNIKKAIEYEVEKHISSLLLNKPIIQATKKWDEKSSKTIFMREKTSEKEYHYICEPNIPTIKLTKEFINNAIKSMRFDCDKIEKDLYQNNVDHKIIEILLNNFDLFKIFHYVTNKIDDYKLAITWIVIELVGLLKKDNFPIKNFSKTKIDQIVIMLKLLKDGKINNRQGKKIIVEIYKTNASVEHIIDKFNFKQITDEKMLNSLLMQIISSNPKLIKEYDTRPEKVEKMIIGKLMEKTKGQANPVLSMSLLKNILKK